MQQFDIKFDAKTVREFENFPSNYKIKKVVEAKKEKKKKYRTAQ